MNKSLFFLVFIFFLFFPLIAEDFTNANGELYYSTENGDNLHLLNFDSVQKFTLSYDDALILKEYDEQKRLSKEIFWKKNDTKVIKTVEYSYFESTFLLDSKKTTEETKIFTEKYNREQKIISNELKNKNQNDGDFFIQQTQNFEYDSENRLAKEITTVFEQEPDLQTVVEKDYSYNDFCDEPNTKITKNGFLESEITYKSKNEYLQKVYLDDEITIVTEYKDNAKIKEIYYNRDKIFRVIE